MYPKEHHLVETQNPQRGIFLDITIYQKMLEVLEAVKSIGAHEKVAQEMESPLGLEDLLERTAIEKESMTLTYQDKLFLAVVPIEEVDLIEQLEDCIDTKAVQKALSEAKEKGTISSEQLHSQLAW